jgi:hypothetical protein
VPAEGTAQLFITVVDDENHGYRCAGAIARRVSEEYINMMIPGPTRIENGHVVRSFVLAGASPRGVDLHYAGGTHKRNAGGTWEDDLDAIVERGDVYATTGSDYGGVVGPIVGDTAHFRYKGVKIAASCGPIVNVPCESGMHRECNLCEDVKLEVRRHGWSYRIPHPLIKCMPACPEPHPSERTIADLDRARRFLSHVDGGGLIVDDSPPSVALYRTLAACHSDPLFKPRKAGVR